MIDLDLQWRKWEGASRIWIGLCGLWKKLVGRGLAAGRRGGRRNPAPPSWPLPGASDRQPRMVPVHAGTGNGFLYHIL